MTGLLQGIRIVEFLGLGPGPFCGMMLADHGAEVIRIERPGARHDPHDVLARSRRSITIDTKRPEGRALARRLAGSADALIEGFRPGVMEKLGLGPDVLLADNPKLVYGRITGWGQDGPLAQTAGHDINYLAVSGVLSTVGRAGENPLPPVNYVGDFGGGGMMLAFAIAAALLHVKMGGTGQVIDAAMMEGASLLAGMVWQLHGGRFWSPERGTNWLDSGAHFYDTYRCADGEYLALGAIEPQFYALLRQGLDMADDPAFDGQLDHTRWPELKGRVAAIIAKRTRAEWCERFAGSDACVSPVLGLDEAVVHPHNQARGNFVEVTPSAMQPAPAPRFSATPAPTPTPARRPGIDGPAILADLGLDPAEIAELEASGALHVPPNTPPTAADMDLMGAAKRR